MIKQLSDWKLLLPALALLLFLPLLALLKPGLPLTHDGLDHVVRIGSFYDSLMEGNLVPRWGQYLNLGYGHPVLLFFYPFSSYLGSFFHYFGLSLVDSTKAVFAFSFVASGLFMYLWLKEFLGSRAAFVGALVYTFAPYRFVDLFVRGAIGECMAFVWLPLILYFGLRFAKKQNGIFLLFGSISIAFLIMSHNLLSLMFLPLVFAYFLFLLFYFSNEKQCLTRLLGLGLMILFGFLTSAFYWLPALLEGKYTLREIVTNNNITGLEPFGRLLYSPWNYGGNGSFTVQLGIVQWLVILLSPLVLVILRKEKSRLFYWALIVLGSFFVGLFFVLPVSKNIYLQLPLLQKFQFGWRFLSLALFAPAVFVAFLISFLREKQKTIVLLLSVVVLLGFNFSYWQPKDYLLKPESYYEKATFTTTNDTGESAPIWSIRRMEEQRGDNLEVIDGKVEIEELKRNSTYHSYRLKVEEKSRLVENTLYFPNWQIFANGKPVNLEFQDPRYRGLMTFDLEPGEYQLEVVFKNTKLRRLAEIVSLSSFVLLVIVAAIAVGYNKKRK